MSTKAIHPEPLSQKLIDRWKSVGQKILRLAEEIPASRFEYRPSDGVRSYADVLRHIAFWNAYLADRVRGKMDEATANELSAKEFSAKEQILNAVERSNTDVLSALREHKSGLNQETFEMLVTFIEHNCEHYGQLTVYARLNGIVPPASRG